VNNPIFGVTLRYNFPMHLDSLSLACWKEETSRSLLPARVQNILHVDPLSFGF
jgi:hypothetical protein